jgi:hypothetical protein
VKDGGQTARVSAWALHYVSLYVPPARIHGTAPELRGTHFIPHWAAELGWRACCVGVGVQYTVCPALCS